MPLQTLVFFHFKSLSIVNSNIWSIKAKLNYVSCWLLAKWIDYVQNVIIYWILASFPLLNYCTFLLDFFLWISVYAEIVCRSKVTRLWCVICISNTISCTRLELEQLLRRFKFNFLFKFSLHRTFRRNVFRGIQV